MCNFVILFSVQNVCRNLRPTSGGVWELTVLPFSRSSSILDQEKRCCVVLVEKRYVTHALPSATPCVWKKKSSGNNFLPKKETCLAVYCGLSKNREAVWVGQFTAGRRLAKSQDGMTATGRWRLKPIHRDLWLIESTEHREETRKKKKLTLWKQKKMKHSE